MIWVAMVLVFLALTAGLVYLFGVRWGRMARHARLEIPCDETVQLPAGDVVVYYEDGFRWRYSEAPRPWDGFSLLISDAESGQRIDLADPPSETAIKRSGSNRVPYGTLRLPRAGRYRVVAQVNADAIDPAVTFG